MLTDRYDPVDLFALIPELSLQMEPELVQLDRLLQSGADRAGDGGTVSEREPWEEGRRRPLIREVRLAGVFFPMAGENEGWARLARNLKAKIDKDRIEAYRGTVSQPFEPGEHRRIAVKIVEDQGIESLKVMEIER